MLGRKYRGPIRNVFSTLQFIPNTQDDADTEQHQTDPETRKYGETLPGRMMNGRYSNAITSVSP